MAAPATRSARRTDGRRSIRPSSGRNPPPSQPYPFSRAPAGKPPWKPPPPFRGNKCGLAQVQHRIDSRKRLRASACHFRADCCVGTCTALGPLRRKTDDVPNRMQSVHARVVHGERARPRTRAGRLGRNDPSRTNSRHRAVSRRIASPRRHGADLRHRADHHHGRRRRLRARGHAPAGPAHPVRRAAQLHQRRRYLGGHRAAQHAHRLHPDPDVRVRCDGDCRGADAGRHRRRQPHRARPRAGLGTAEPGGAGSVSRVSAPARRLRQQRGVFGPLRPGRHAGPESRGVRRVPRLPRGPPVRVLQRLQHGRGRHGRAEQGRIRSPARGRALQRDADHRQERPAGPSGRQLRRGTAELQRSLRNAALQQPGLRPAGRAPLVPGSALRQDPQPLRQQSRSRDGRAAADSVRAADASRPSAASRRPASTT